MLFNKPFTSETLTLIKRILSATGLTDPFTLLQHLQFFHAKEMFWINQLTIITFMNLALFCKAVFS